MSKKRFVLASVVMVALSTTVYAAPSISLITTVTSARKVKLSPQEQAVTSPSVRMPVRRTARVRMLMRKVIT